MHGLTDGVLPMLQAEADASDIWERLIDQLIGLALENRRLIELHIRNQEAVAEIHRGPGLEKHGPVPHDVDQHVLGLLRDPSLPVDGRVRRTASFGVIAAVLLAARAFADVPDVELEPALRTVVHDVIGGRTEASGTSSRSASPHLFVTANQPPHPAGAARGRSLEGSDRPAEDLRPAPGAA